MEHDTAGDPISGIKWTRRTAPRISDALFSLEIHASSNTVARLLKQLGFRLRVNRKKIARVSHVDRDHQFGCIEQHRKLFESKSLPVISVDTKKKELIGNFKNAGTTMQKEAIDVLDHDFRSDAEALAVPYGIYDLQQNQARVFVGLSADTSAFAVDAVVHWWAHEGRRTYPNADRVLILADSGGSNGARVRAWKFELQSKLCDRFGIGVTVCHYPSGASKWNPIEHRLFAHISRNWQGQPLRSIETMIKYIRTTSTSTGLRVRASITRRHYPKGVKITDDQMAELNLFPHDVLPNWNYTLLPRNLN